MPRPVSSRKKPPHATASRVRTLPGTVFITRQVHFNSAHRLFNPDKGQAWNERQYGLCTSPHWHGHNYVLEVTLKGRPDPVTGYLMDLGALKRLLHRAIVDKCDHRNLNDDVDFLRGLIPTTENLVIAFWQQIAPHIPPPAQLYCVRLYETPRNFAEFFGPDNPPEPPPSRP